MIGMKTRLASVAALAVAATFAYATPAAAQATRTWVSGVGDDVNPCSRTAPCKTFAGAISKTANGGEINCLDPGGFGAVSIIKSMTISCPYTEGGLLAGGNGIVVNAQPADVIYLRGLDIFGVAPPTHGVRIIAAGAVHIEDSTIRRFNAANSFGVSYQPGGITHLYMNNVTVADNGAAGSGGGILIQPTGAGGNARVVLENVRVQNNNNFGLRIDSTGNTGASGNAILISNSRFAGNVNGGVSANHGAGTNVIGVMLTDSTIVNNGGFGIGGNGTGLTMRVGNTTVHGNSGGVSAGTATINTYGDNRVIGNPVAGAANNGAFTGVPIGKQ